VGVAQGNRRQVLWQRLPEGMVADASHATAAQWKASKNNSTVQPSDERNWLPRSAPLR